MEVVTDLEKFYRGKKVFITGHTGFKGSWLSFWLTQLGAEVTGYALEPEHKNSLFYKLSLSAELNNNIADIRDLDKLSLIMNNAKPDLVFHLAAQSLVKKAYDEPVLTFSTNVIGSLNLLEAVRSCPSVKSLVYITSDKCYLNKEWVWGYRENDSLGGQDPYSASKACAEHVFQSYYSSYFKDRNGFGCGSTRAGNVIGGGDLAKDRVVPDIIKAIEEHKPVILRNPESTRPWQHVLDPLHGYLQLGIHLYKYPSYNGEAWNFGPLSNSIKTVHELAKSLTSLWNGIDIKIPKIEKQYHEATLLHLSIDKVQTILKWKPKLHFDQAVLKTGEWYKRVQDGENPKDITRKQIMDFLCV